MTIAVNGSTVLIGNIYNSAFLGIQSVPDLTSTLGGAAAKFVDLQRVANQGGWTTTQNIDPSAYGSYSFTNGSSTIRVDYSQITNGSTQSQNLTTPIGISYSATTRQTGLQTAGQQGTNNLNIAINFNFSDNGGTANPGDDKSSAGFFTAAQTITNTRNGNDYTSTASGDGSGQQSYDGLGYKLQSSVSSTYNSSYSSNSVARTSSSYFRLVDLVNSYQFSNSNTGFTYSFVGTSTIDTSVGKQTIDLRSYSLQTPNYTLTALNIPLIQLTLPPNTPTSPFVSVVNLGTSAADDLSLVQSSNEQYILPGVLAGDNNISIKSVSGYSIDAGAGDDLVMGEIGSDNILGSDGQDSLYGNKGADYLSGNSGNDNLDGGDNIKASTAGGQVYRLYLATLARAPDVSGYLNWQNTITSGRTLLSITSGFINSAEFQQRYGNLNNTQFVTLLYQNVLHRAPDAGGLANWVNSLNTGASRESVVNGFSESQEFQNSTNLPSTAFVTSQVNANTYGQVYRLYGATLNREPDAVGFIDWFTTLANGTSLQTITTGFIHSAEFQQTYGNLNNTQFVTLLYNNVLHRAPDSSGLNNWVNSLNAGTAREAVVNGFSESQEYQNSTNSSLLNFMSLSLSNITNTLLGGEGENTIIGGLGADIFKFDLNHAGVDNIYGLQQWDVLNFTNFGYTSASNAIGHMTQSGSDVIFSDRSQFITFHDTSVAAVSNLQITIG
jgi:hypothetical protein